MLDKQGVGYDSLSWKERDQKNAIQEWVKFVNDRVQLQG